MYWPSRVCLLSSTWRPHWDAEEWSWPCSAWSTPASCHKCPSWQKHEAQDRSETQPSAWWQSWLCLLNGVPRTAWRGDFPAIFPKGEWPLSWKTAKPSSREPRCRIQDPCQLVPETIIFLDIDAGFKNFLMSQFYVSVCYISALDGSHEHWPRVV